MDSQHPDEATVAEGGEPMKAELRLRVQLGATPAERRLAGLDAWHILNWLVLWSVSGKVPNV